MPFTFTINGHTYTSDPSNISVPDGYRFIGYGYITALGNLAADIAAVAAQVLTNAGTASSAAATAVSAPGTSATSTTSLAIGSGTKNLTVQAGKSIPVGASVKIARTSDVTAWMHGGVVSYDSGTGALQVLVPSGDTNGSGTFANWTVSLSAPRGPQGLSGLDGADFALTKTSRNSGNNATITSGDVGKWFSYTGTLTQAVTSAVTLGNGFTVFLSNDSAGFPVIDPNGAEQITVNGVARSTYTLWPGEQGILTSDGAGLNFLQTRKGRITQTVSSTVGNVSFSTALAYRRHLALTIEDLASSTANDGIYVDLNLSSVASTVFYGSNTGATNTDAGSTLHLTVSSGGAYGDLKQNATGSSRLQAALDICLGDVGTVIDLGARYQNNSSANKLVKGTAVCSGVTDATISSIRIVSLYSTLTAGTFTLEEI